MRHSPKRADISGDTIVMWMTRLIALNEVGLLPKLTICSSVPTQSGSPRVDDRTSQQKRWALASHSATNLLPLFLAHWITLKNASL